MKNQRADEGSIAVVIPCYRCDSKIFDVLARLGPEVRWIFLVDDACPEKTGLRVINISKDPRLSVIFHEKNQGVGGAVITGYKAALKTPAAIVVKIDGDGQMAPELIPYLCGQILRGAADYSKGNRFHLAGSVAGMPVVRRMGNIGLSFITKLSSGYWQLFDPTNGFTAIHSKVLRELDLETISKRYFFESDMLFRLNQLRAVVSEMPMKAVYDGEPSSLSPFKVIVPFLKGNLKNFFSRIFHRYFIADFSLATFELVFSIPLILFGFIYGAVHFFENYGAVDPVSAGIVMTAALPIILGFQLFLSWLNYDVSNQPAQALHTQLPDFDV